MRIDQESIKQDIYILLHYTYTRPDYYYEYRIWEIWQGKILMNLANPSLFTKIFLVNINRYGKIIFGILINCHILEIYPPYFIYYFYLHGLPKIFPTKIFLCTALFLSGPIISP